MIMSQLKTLTEMGYDKHTSKMILKRYNNDIHAAIKYFQLIPSEQIHNTDIIDKMNYPYSHSIKENELCVGDHIYVWRTLYLYQHHGIYIGNGRVIHFSGEVRNAYDSTITETSVTQFSKGDTIKRVQYNVSEHYFKWNRGGSSNSKQADNPEIIVNRAKSALGWARGQYDIEKYNCETFCLWCSLGARYDDSIQFKTAINNIGIGGSVIGFILGGMSGAAIGAGVGFRIGKTIKDIINESCSYSDPSVSTKKMVIEALKVYGNDVEAVLQSLLVDGENVEA
eukprot:6744_1